MASTLEEQRRKPVTSLVDQIPTTGYPKIPDAPRNPVMESELGRNVVNAAMAIPGTRAAMGVGGIVSRLIGPTAAAGGAIAKTAQAAAPLGVPAAGMGALQYAAAPPATAAAPAAAAPVAPAASSMTAQKPQVNPINVPIAPAGTAVEGAPGARRYVDANGKVLYSNVGNTMAIPTPGAVSTAAAPAAPAGPTLSMGTDAALSAARSAAMARGDVAGVAASYGAQGQGFAGAPAGGPSTAARLREQTAGKTLNRNGAAALVSAEQNELASQRAGVDAASAGVSQAEGQQRLAANVQTMAAQQAFLDAQASGDAKAIERAETNLRALTGKFEASVPDLYSATAIPGGVDPVTGQPMGSGALVLNRRTGEREIVSPGDAKTSGGKAAPAAKYETGKVYKDANGNRAKWDGKKFVPV